MSLIGHERGGEIAHKRFTRFLRILSQCGKSLLFSQLEGPSGSLSICHLLILVASKLLLISG